MNFNKKIKILALVVMLVPSLGLSTPEKEIDQQRSTKGVQNIESTPSESDLPNSRIWTPTPQKIIEISKIRYSNLVLIDNNSKNN
jgi:hypothetical protein